MTDDAYATYLSERGLTPTPAPSLAEYTPLMSTGPGGHCVDAAKGSLPGGATGAIAHTVFKSSTDERGEEKFTIAIVAIQEAVAFARNLACRDHKLQERLNSTELSRFGDSKRVQLESVAFDQRYAVQAPPEVDATWLRELFAPSLVDWLTNEAPPEFSFELNEGHFTAAIPGHAYDPEVLDAFCKAASEVAGRIAAEALEQVGQASQATDPEADARFEKLLSKVRFDSPPPDVATASKRYVGVASWRLGQVGKALAAALRHLPSAGALTTIIAITVVLVVGPDPVSLVVWIVPALLGTLAILWWNVHRQGQALADRLGEEAFVRGYAESRGLKLEDAMAYQAAHARLKLPGAARHVMSGKLPGTSIQGAIALCDRDVERSTQLFQTGSDAVKGGMMEAFGSMSAERGTYDVAVFEAPGTGPIDEARLQGVLPAPAGLQLQAMEGVKVSQTAEGTVVELPPEMREQIAKAYGTEWAAGSNMPATIAGARAGGTINVSSMMKRAKQAMEMMQNMSAPPMITADGRTVAYMHRTGRDQRSAAGLDALCAQAAQVEATIAAS